MTTTRIKRLLLGTTLAGALVFGTAAGSASAQDDSDDDNGVAAADTDDGYRAEHYPPKKKKPGAPGKQRPLPATGSDGTEMWLKVGTGALLAGGLLVAGSARRRTQLDQQLTA